jgi:methyl-accepting chemotaxis protein
MNEFLQQGLISLGALPIAYLLLRLIFKKSIMFRFSLYTVFYVLFVSYTSYFESHLGTLWSIAITVMNIGVGFIVFQHINKILRKPLDKTILQLKELSNGNLAVTTQPDTSSNELGILANSTHTLKTKLLEIMGEISHNAANLSKVSEQLNATSQGISQGTNEQASSLEEISSTMEEMASNISNNTTNARHTATYSIEMANEINEVKEAAQKSLQAVITISEQIQLIKDIAFQTNILSLNAAVEAANAGEHGRGFSVVAAEVKKLADKSKTTAELIERLSNDSLKITQYAGQLFKQVVPKVEKTNALIQEISAASLEQSSGVEQVNGALQGISQGSQQGATISEEMSANAEELTEQANSLKQTISYFRF